MAVGLRCEAVAKYRGRETRHRFTEASTAASSAQRFPACGAGVGEVEVLHRDGGDVVAQGVVDEPGDRMPNLGIPTCR